MHTPWRTANTPTQGPAPTCSSTGRGTPGGMTDDAPPLPCAERAAPGTPPPPPGGPLLPKMRAAAPAPLGWPTVDQPACFSPTSRMPLEAEEAALPDRLAGAGGAAALAAAALAFLGPRGAGRASWGRVAGAALAGLISSAPAFNHPARPAVGCIAAAMQKVAVLLLHRPGLQLAHPSTRCKYLW